MSKRILATLVAVAAVVSGCGYDSDSDGNSRPGTVKPHYVDLPDGRKVLCVWEKNGYGGGPSCDWSKAA